MSLLEERAVRLNLQLRDTRNRTLSDREFDYGMKERALWREESAAFIKKELDPDLANALQQFEIPQNAYVPDQELANFSNERSDIFLRHYGKRATRQMTRSFDHSIPLHIHSGAFVRPWLVPCGINLSLPRREERGFYAVSPL